MLIMREDDPLAQSYDFDQITVDSVREQGRREALTALSGAFDLSGSKVLPDSKELSAIARGVSNLDSSATYMASGAKLSDPYESFTRRDGMEIESRILCMTQSESQGDMYGGLHMSLFLGMHSVLGRRTQSDTQISRIFLLVATEKDQASIGPNNVRYGAFQKGNGQVEFFHLSTLSEMEDSDMPDHLRAMMSYAGMSDEAAEQYLKADALDPLQEKALAIEFGKATQVLLEKAEKLAVERESLGETSCIDGRPLPLIMRHITGAEPRDHELITIPSTGLELFDFANFDFGPRHLDMSPEDEADSDFSVAGDGSSSDEAELPEGTEAEPTGRDRKQSRYRTY